jgi:hypothetical protein
MGSRVVFVSGEVQVINNLRLEVEEEEDKMG